MAKISLVRVSAGLREFLQQKVTMANPIFYDMPTNAIPGATNSSLTITNAQFASAGYYGVVVSNSAGSTFSDLANMIVYTNATPALSGIVSANGQFQFTISGVTRLNYVVEGSTNLMDWVPLGTNTPPFSFMDSNMDIYPQRYYRAVFIQ
jgi:hypothetical protein